MFEHFEQRAARLDHVGGQVVHMDVALVADHQPAVAVEHAQALRHVVERGVDMDIRALQFARLFGQAHLAFGQRGFRFQDTLKLPAQLFEQEGRADQSQQRADAQQRRPAIPIRQRGAFRNRDIDDQGIIAQRLHRDEAGASVEISRRAIAAAALGDQFIPRRPFRHFLVAAIDLIGMAHQDGAVAAQHEEGLIAQPRDRVVDAFEMRELYPGHRHAEEFVVGAVQPLAEKHRPHPGYAIDQEAADVDASVVLVLEVLEIVAVGKIALGRRPEPRCHCKLSVAVDECDEVGLRQTRQTLSQGGIEVIAANMPVEVILI